MLISLRPVEKTAPTGIGNREAKSTAFTVSTEERGEAGIEKVLRFRKSVREEFDRMIGEVGPSV